MNYVFWEDDLGRVAQSDRVFFRAEDAAAFAKDLAEEDGISSTWAAYVHAEIMQTFRKNSVKFQFNKESSK